MATETGHSNGSKHLCLHFLSFVIYYHSPIWVASSYKGNVQIYIPFSWSLYEETTVNMLFTFSQVNWDKGLLYKDFSLTFCHLYCLFHLPFWIEALSRLWMIQEGSGQLNKTIYTACSLKSLCGKSKLFRGLMLFTVDNSKCSWILIFRLRECEKNP